jgi:hypothetical protein
MKSRFAAWKNTTRLAAALVLTVTLRAEEIWRLDSLEKIGGHPVTVEGAPHLIDEGGAKVMTFDGLKDGVFVPAIPFAGAKAFTIEILFRPAEGGPEAQRFVHAEDTAGARAMIETRVDGKGHWWLDTFLLSAGKTDGLPLIDAKLVHPTNRWYWAALRYDGKTMTSYVNGEKELTGEIAIAPFVGGKISLGVRQNKVYWFKGAIREVRFHTEAVAPEELQRVK